jgi:hypothetical protein
MIGISDKRIYFYLIAALVAGMVWLCIQFDKGGMATPEGSACLISRVSGHPCPSCGTTRSAVAILHGDFEKGIKTNPAGLLILSMMTVLIILFCIDLLYKKKMVPLAYRKAEKIISNRYVALFIIALVLSNWCWNIVKEL